MAVEQIKTNKLGIQEASKLFGIPRSTIQDRLKGKLPQVPRKTGPPPVPSVEGEAKIAR